MDIKLLSKIRAFADTRTLPPLIDGQITPQAYITLCNRLPIHRQNTLTRSPTRSLTLSITPYFLHLYHVFIPPDFHRFTIKSLMQSSTLQSLHIEYYNKHMRHLVEDSDGKIQQYRLLLMDNHSSHLTWQFVEYALAHKIVLVALLPHSTYKLQLLDVGCFGPLSHYYGKQVDDFC